ncbi:MAG TPA: SRPBCC domain-containing protein [Fimbriimonadaceae bacterium]|nr:SRPBCC domain-containing protein [Fimbriimonadaceae bacterium]
MSVNVGEDGRRSVQVEVEVSGTPEEVWQAIATGPGISSWFVPTEVEERVGGKFTASFGPGMESESTITKWDPPRSFTKDGDGMDPDAPPVATEWIVEAKAGGKCVVRVVHSWFASSDEWDGQWEAVEGGWKSYFDILRLKLTHFRGQPCAAFEMAGMSSGSDSEAWAALTAPLGLTGAAVGQEARSGADAPAFSGKVEVTGQGDEKYAMLRIDQPGPGGCHLFAMPMGEQTYVSIRFFLFGEGAAAAAAKAEPEWSRWFGEKFPMEG